MSTHLHPAQLGDRRSARDLVAGVRGLVAKGEANRVKTPTHRRRMMSMLFDGERQTFQMAGGRSHVADDAVCRLADWVRPQLGL